MTRGTQRSIRRYGSDTILVLFMAACGSEPTSEGPPFVPPSFSVGGTSCSEAWGVDGPGHHPYDTPEWRDASSQILSTCGDLEHSDSVRVTWTWGAGQDATHSVFQIASRVRKYDGTSTFDTLWHGALPTNPGFPTWLTWPLTTESFWVEAGDDVDAISIVMHYGDTTYAIDEEYFTEGTYGDPDQNMYAQIWFAIPPVQDLILTPLGGGAVELEWTNSAISADHYRTEILRNGNVDTTLAATATSVVRSANDTTLFGVRLVADPPFTGSQNLLPEPASDTVAVLYTPPAPPPVASITFGLDEVKPKQWCDWNGSASDGQTPITYKWLVNGSLESTAHWVSVYTFFPGQSSFDLTFIVTDALSRADTVEMEVDISPSGDVCP